MNEQSTNGVNRRQALMAAAASAAAVGVFSGLSHAEAQTPTAAAALTDDLVLGIVQGALKHAQSLGIPYVVAVVDSAGTEIAFVRQNGALVISNTLAPQKAYTAAVLGAPTADIAKGFGSDQTLAMSILKVPNVTLLGGGLPIMVNGVAVGGVGASSGTVDQDIEVATAGLKAVGLA